MLLDTLREGGAVPAVDHDLVVATPDRTHLTPHDLPRVGLRVDDPYARRRNEHVVDVAACPWNQPIVQRDDSVAHLSRDEGSEPVFALAASTPRCRGIARGHLFGDASGMVAVNINDLHAQ